MGAGRRERGRDSIREILPEKLLSEKAGRAEQKGEGKAWCGEREGGKEMHSVLRGGEIQSCHFVKTNTCIWSIGLRKVLIQRQPFLIQPF